MADPPRAPLVVIPEASWFPTAFAAPWVRRDALGAESSVTSSDVQDRGVLHSQTCPVLPLPRPVVVLNTDDTTSSALETSRRDHDSEIAAHPDFLRTLGWMHGDVVEVTEHVGGETRVGRIVAATRWEEDGGAGKGVDEAEDGEDDLDAEASAACDETERNTYEASSKSLLLTNKLYLPPAMRRNLKLHVHFALQDAFTAVEKCRAPVICAMQGACFGGGVDLAVACDIRVCADDTKFCVKEVDLAIVADIGTLQRLPLLVGHGIALEWALTARVVDAEEALAAGLVTKVVPSQELLAVATELAQNIAQKSPLATQGTKTAALHSRDHSVEDGLVFVAHLNSARLQSADLDEAMAAKFGNRKPTYAKL